MKLNNALLIQPISAAKMMTGLSPDRVLARYFGDLAASVETPTNDVAFIFTSGLYQNNDSLNPRIQRMSLLQREGEWRIRFEKLMRRYSDQSINGFPLIREGFHLAGWDSGITQDWNDFSQHIERLKKSYRMDGAFQNMIHTEIKAMGREPSEGTVSFILEEIAVMALWLEGKTNIPKGLRETDDLSALHLVYPSSIPRFLAEGMDLLLKDRKGVIPLVWIDTSNEQEKHPMMFRFGRDVPAMAHH